MRTVPSTGTVGGPVAIPRDADRPLTGRSILPVAAAIGAFGVVYGTVAASVLGPTTTVASSL